MRKTLAPLLLIPLLAFSAGAAVGAMIVAPRLAADAPADGLEQLSAQEAVDAGRIALHLPGHELPVIVEVDVTVDPEHATDLVIIRDKLIELAASTIEMPIVHARHADMDNIRRAILIVAKQEAPWLSGLEMSVVWSADS